MNVKIIFSDDSVVDYERIDSISSDLVGFVTIIGENQADATSYNTTDVKMIQVEDVDTDEPEDEEDEEE